MHIFLYIESRKEELFPFFLISILKLEEFPLDRKQAPATNLQLTQHAMMQKKTTRATQCKHEKPSEIPAYPITP